MSVACMPRVLPIIEQLWSSLAAHMQNPWLSALELSDGAAESTHQLFSVRASCAQVFATQGGRIVPSSPAF